MKKIKIIGKDNVGWSIDKDNKNLNYFLSKINDINITERYFSADFYIYVWHNLVLHPRYIFVPILKFLSIIFGKRKKIIVWVTNDITKNKIPFFLKYIVNLWIAPNSKIANFLEKNNMKNIKIPFFVSVDEFKKLLYTKNELSLKLGINFKDIEGKLLIGSFQRDSLGSDLRQPKWQKNPDLLIEICKLLPPKKYILILAGPRRHYLINKCLNEKIPFLFLGDENYIKKGKDDILINNLDESKINLLYNLIDVYLITSKSESGPKAVLEASLTKTLIFSTPVGLAPDFLHPNLLYNEENLDDIVNFLKDIMLNNVNDKKEEYINFNFNRVISVLSEDNYKMLIKKAIDIA